MYKSLFQDFLKSNNTLAVYENGSMIFTSEKDRLLPLLDFMKEFGVNGRDNMVVFDKIIGNAAALLSIRAGCSEVYSPMGSELAIDTLDKYNITHNITELIPYIKQANGVDMCPMEKLSIGKDPEEFYQALIARIRQGEKKVG